jgi:hypothetical protein
MGGWALALELPPHSLTRSQNTRAHKHSNMRRSLLQKCDEQRLHFRSTLATLRSEFERSKTNFELAATLSGLSLSSPSSSEPSAGKEQQQ